MSAPANLLQTMPRRPIKLAWHFPPTVRELEALYELSKLPARVIVYAGSEPQALGPAKALGPAINSTIVGSQIVVTAEWRGCEEPPADWMAIVGYHEEPPKRRAANYPGMGSKA